MVFSHLITAPPPFTDVIVASFHVYLTIHGSSWDAEFLCAFRITNACPFRAFYLLFFFFARLESVLKSHLLLVVTFRCTLFQAMMIDSFPHRLMDWCVYSTLVEISTMMINWYQYVKRTPAVLHIFCLFMSFKNYNYKYFEMLQSTHLRWKSAQ